MSHTIGPWRVMHATSQERDAMRIIYSADLQRVAVIPDVEFAAQREAIGDARLIAAAPDLLHALRLMLREHDALQLAEGSTEDRWTAATIARAAINKAEGKQ